MKILSQRPHDDAEDDPLPCCDFCFVSRFGEIYSGGKEPIPFFAVTFDDGAGEYWACQTCMADGTLQAEMECAA